VWLIVNSYYYAVMLIPVIYLVWIRLTVNCVSWFLVETVITFHINASSVDVVKKVRAELRCRVTDMLVVVPVVHDVIPRLSPQVIADIAKLESSNVHIDIGKFSRYCTSECDTIRCDIVYLVCSGKLTCSLLSPPHGTVTFRFYCMSAVYLLIRPISVYYHE